MCQLAGPVCRRWVYAVGAQQVYARHLTYGYWPHQVGTGTLDLTFDKHIHGGYKGLAALTKLPNVQHFVLAVGDADYMWEEYCFKDPSLTPSDVLPGALLAGVTNLTHLNIRGHDN